MANPTIRYKVAGAHPTKVIRTAKFNGADIEASVPALVVECVSADAGMGHTFTFVGAEADEAAALFVPGANVTATFKKDT
jgi:hypothetical protein